MNKKLVGSFLVLAALAATMVSASPNLVAVDSGALPHKKNVSPQSSGPFSSPSQLNVNGIKLGMSKDEIGALHLSRETWPTDLKYGQDSRVTFVAGPVLKQADRDLGEAYEPIMTLHRWGKPILQESTGRYTVAAYTAGNTIVIMRYEPASLDSRRGAIGDIAITTDVAWVPYDWGHAALQRAGL